MFCEVCVFVCVPSNRKNSVSVCLPNWVIGCLLTLRLAFKKRTMSALSLKLFTWKSPSGASLTHPHDPRQQNMECISNPAQKYEYKSCGFYGEYLMCNGSLCTVWMCCCSGLAIFEWCTKMLCESCVFLLVFSHFQRVILLWKLFKCAYWSAIMATNWKYIFFDSYLLHVQIHSPGAATFNLLSGTYKALFSFFLPGINFRGR